MNKFKKVIGVILSIFLLGAGVFLTACKNGNENMSIGLNVNSVEILLGKTENNSAIVRAIVSNAKDMEIELDYDSQSIRLSKNYLGDGITDITVEALKQCSNVEVNVIGANKNVKKTFTVNAITPIVSIASKNSSLAMSFDKDQGGQLTFTNSMFTITPNDTLQTKLNYSLLTEYEGISIENNILKISPDAINVPDAITVEVSSAFNSEIKTSVEVKIFPNIDKSKISILTKEGAQLTAKEFNLARNSAVSNSLTLKVQIPFSISSETLKIIPSAIFQYGEMGITLNEVVETKNEMAQGGYYEYEFTFSTDSSTTVGVDYLWFNFYYEDYPTINVSTISNKLKITTFDEITNISCIVDGSSIGQTTSFNVYTIYESNTDEVEGLSFKFSAIPTTAISGKLRLEIQESASLNYLTLKDFQGNEIELTAVDNGVGEKKTYIYSFDSGSTIYAVAKTGFGTNKNIDIKIISEENEKISKSLSIVLNEGITELGFLESFGSSSVVKTNTYYFENDTDSDASKGIIYFAVAPNSIPRTSITIQTTGELIDFQENLTSGTIGTKAYFGIKVQAKDGVVGTGTIIISFESGQQIKADINVFTKLENVNVKIDPTFNTSSAVGNLKYENDSLSYIAVKNGQSLPLNYETNANIDSVSYSYVDLLLNKAEHNVYDTSVDNKYYLFNSKENIDNFDELLKNLSTIISSNYLRALKYISPIQVGKVWVKISFTGKSLKVENGEIKHNAVVETVVEKYVLVETYNPISTLSLTDRSVELYAYDEVGETNKNLSKSTIKVVLNEGGLTPTYDRILFNGSIIDKENQLTSYSKDGKKLFTISYLGTSTYLITAYTRNANAEDENDKFRGDTISIRVNDLNLDINEWIYLLKISMKTPQNVTSVATTNIPETGIYLTTKNVSSSSLSDNSFKIQTTVGPQDALNKSVVYRFIPNVGTSSDIITISPDGLVNVVGDFGGKGIIRIIPDDCVLIDDYGNEYYKDGTEKLFVDVKITVADGASKETAIHITNLSEIKNYNLHYILTQDISYDSQTQLFETFNGGLYGCSIDNNNIASITLLGSNLFKELGVNAVIEDIIICGNVNSQGIIANINNGTIKNVVVDIFSLNGVYTNSSVNSNAIAGGLVGVNNGLVENSSFAGSVNGSIVGGIAGENTGIITNTKVLIYNLQNGQMKISGTKHTGGLVGKMSASAKLSNSYIYNYSSTNEISQSTQIMGLVGIITSKNVRISKCFATIGKTDSFASLDESLIGDVSQDKVLEQTEILNKSIIKDSYILSTSGEGYKFTSYMSSISNVNVKFVKNSASEVFENILFGSSRVWNKSSQINNGYPYLNEVIYENSLTNDELNALTIKDSRLSLSEMSNVDGKNIAIMYVYRPEIVLSSKEQSALNNANTIYLFELFGTTNVNGLMVSSSNTNVIVPSLNSLYMKGTGRTTLTISSKYDYSVAPKQIEIVVLNYADKLSLTYRDTKITSGSVLNIKSRTTETITSSVGNGIVLVDRFIPIKTNDYIVNFQSNGEKFNYIVGQKIGSHIISSNFDTDLVGLGAYLSVDLSQMIDDVEERNVISNYLKEKSMLEFSLNKVYGAISVNLSLSSAKISPSDVLIVKATLCSDINTTKISSILLDNINILTENSSEILNATLNSQTTPVFDSVNNYYVSSFEFAIKVTDSFKSNIFENEKYDIKFVSNDADVYATATVEIQTQEVIRVEVNNYSYKGNDAVNNGSYYNYYPNNITTPGSSSLLSVSLYPNYASYDYITITSEPVNSQSLSLISMRKLNGVSYSVNDGTNFEFITNGIKVYALGNLNDIGMFYAKASVSSSVSFDTVFVVNVNVYRDNKLIFTTAYSLVVVPQEKAIITVNGETSTYALFGEKLTADIVIEQTQNIKSISISPSTAATLEYVDSYKYTDYGAKYKKTAISFTVGNAINRFSVDVTTSRYINGIEESTTSSLIVYAVEFQLDFDNTHVKETNDSIDNVSVGNKYFYTPLTFVFAGKYTNYGKNAYDKFLNQYSYSRLGDFPYKVNTDVYSYAVGSTKTYSLVRNLYYVNGNTTTPIIKTNNDGTYTFTENNVLEFATDNNGGINTQLSYIGKAIGSQQMLLEMSVSMPDGTDYTYSYYFTITISKSTDEDVPEQISSQEEFEAVANQESAADYMLTKDIYLYNYKPFEDTSKFNSLDGNGHQIIIMNYNTEDMQGEMNLALFNTVSSNTTIKNLNVNVYHIGKISIDATLTTNVNIAGLAIKNEGIITNSQILAYQYKINEISPIISGMNVTITSTQGVTAKTAGFVISNSGSITNSRVGGESYTNYDVNDIGIVNTSIITLSPFVINSFGEISGFVYDNSGLISSSYASNMRIINNSNVDYTSFTAGFVVYNSGSINMSYVKGVKHKSTDIHATKFGIETSGISAGFVYQNDSIIRNAYANITLTNTGNNPGRASSGFAYINSKDAGIYTSYSFSKIIGSSTTQMNFLGVDEWGNFKNKGIVENCYYYDDSDINTDTANQSNYQNAKKIEAVSSDDYFYGFSFTSVNSIDGIWKLTTTGPELVSANDIAVSLRYASKVDKTKFTYAYNYEYGSKSNPIIIRNANEFNNVMGGATSGSVTNYFNSGKKVIFGNYRLVNNIDLSELITDTINQSYRLNSSKMALTGAYQDSSNGSSIGKFDGNGLSIFGFALADTTEVSASGNFGLFASIESGALVSNLNISIGSTNNEGTISGVEAKNIEYVGALAGTVLDSKVVNVNLKSAYENTNKVTVRGKNIVGGLIGRVIGDSYIFNLSVENVSVTAANFPSSNGLASDSSFDAYNKYSRLSDLANEAVSYAGGIVGVIDTYLQNNITVDIFDDEIISGNGNAIMLKTKGQMIITAGTVGGVVGYVGPLVILQDALFELSAVEDDKMQGLYAYNGFAGGVVGYNRGYIRQSRAEHESTLQSLIENNVGEYYKGDYTVERGNESLFFNENYKPTAIGGLVGVQLSGKVEKSYSKLNVIAVYTGDKKVNYLGGLIGNVFERQISELTPNFDEIYAFGDVCGNEQSTIGGVFGFLKVETYIRLVNGANYWGNWMKDKNDSSYTKFSYFANTGMELSGNCFSHNQKSVIFENTTKSPITEKSDTKEKLKQLNSFKDIAKDSQSGELFDPAFMSNNWSPKSWKRDSDELFPHILFGYFSDIIYIETEDDINKMRFNSENKTYVIRPLVTDEDDVSKIIHITKKIIPILNFRGTLRGLDATGDYGFSIDTQLSQALFDKTNGASFKNFKIMTGLTNTIQTTNSNASVLVKNAESTSFENLQLANIKISVLTDTSDVNAGLLAANLTGGSSIDNIKMSNCSISVSNNKSANVGLVFGQSKFNNDPKDTNGNVSNIEFSQSSIKISGDSKENENTNYSNIGIIGGSFQSTTKMPYYVSSDSSNNSNYQIIIDGKRPKLNVGMLFGQTVEINISSASNSSGDRAKIAGQIQIDSLSGATNSQYSNIGGVVGYADSSTIQNLIVSTQIRTKETKSTQPTNIIVDSFTNYGCAVGSMDNSNLKDVFVDMNEFSLSLTNNKDSSNTEANKNIGGLVGKLSQSIINDCASNASMNLTFTYKDKNAANIGGLAGSFIYSEITTSVGLPKIDNYYVGTITVVDNEKTASFNLGGIIGYAQFNTLDKSITNVSMFGNIVLNNNANNEAKESTYNIGGICGSIDIKAKLQLNNIVSAGEISLYEGEYTNDTKRNITNLLNCGGVIGYINGDSNGEVTLNTIVSLTTIMNTLSNNIAGTSHINAIIGNGKVNATDVCYSHVATLCTDENIVNFKNLNFDGDSNALNKALKILSVDYAEKSSYFADGSKMNPHCINDTIKNTTLATENGADNSTKIVSSKEIRTGYYLLQKDGCIVESQLSIGKSKKNNDHTVTIQSRQGLISDGKSMFSLNGESTYGNVFDTVSHGSFVSGVIVSNFGYFVNSQSKDVSGFVGTNYGTIYSCSAKGNTSTEVNALNKGTLNGESRYVSGFVTENEGIIKDCFSYLDLISTQVVKNNSTTDNKYNPGVVNGFVKINNGVIDTAYCLGSVKNSEVSWDSKYVRTNIYAFGLNNGVMNECYSLSTIADLKNAATVTKNYYNKFDNNIHIIGNSQNAVATNCWYDGNALEIGNTLNDKEYDAAIYKDTNDCSTNYIENNITSFKLTCDKTLNFGYPGFNGGAYENIKYMQINSGDGKEQTPFQILNFGKLQQLNCLKGNESLFFNLVNDIYAGVLTNDETTFEGINAKTGILDGEDSLEQKHTIANLTTETGLFTSIENCVVKNIIFNDCTVCYTTGNIAGILCQKSIDSEIDNIAGILCQKSIDSEIDNITIKNIIINIKNLSNSDLFIFGSVVGLMSGTSTIKNCNTNAMGSTPVSITMRLSKNWIIGGFVGQLDGGTVTKCYMSAQFNVGSTDIGSGEKEVVAGGIVGQQNGGKIELCEIQNDMNILTNSESNADIILTVGGIVGESKRGTITKCLTLRDKIIKAGTQNNVIRSYVGGISGKGGIIDSCVNFADILGYAKITIYKGSTKVVKTTEACDRLIFATVEQLAYTAGISNEYTSVKNCYNFSSNIAGGMKSVNVYSFYDVDEGYCLKRAVIIGVREQAVQIAFTAWVVSHFTTTIIDDIITFAGLGIATVAYVVDLCASITVNSYYSFGNGDIGNYDFYAKYGTYPLLEILGFLNMTKVEPDPKDMGSLPTSNYDMIRYIKTTCLFEDESLSLFEDESLSWLNTDKGFKKDTNGYIYHDNLVVEELYTDAIGISSGSGIKTNCHSVSSSVTIVSIGDKNYYGINDNTTCGDKGGTLFDTYKVVYNIDNNFDITQITPISTIIDPDGDGNGWVDDGNGGFVYDGASIVQKTNIDDLNVKFDEDKLTIIVSSYEDMRGVSALVNKEVTNAIIDDDKMMFAGVNDALKASYKAFFSNYNKGNNNSIFNILINKDFEDVNYIPLGTENNPFNGEINGINVIIYGTQELTTVTPDGITKAATNNTTGVVSALKSITGIKQSKTTNFGLVAYAKNVTINNIFVQEDIVNINTSDKVYSLGGLIGEVVKGGKVEINKSSVDFNYTDLKINSKLQKLYTSKFAYVGGLVGKVDTDGQLEIYNSSIRPSAQDYRSTIKIQSYNTSGTNGLGSIGGLVGQFEGAKLTIAGEYNYIKQLQIIEKGSLNPNVGGVVGCINNGNAELSIGNVEIFNGVSFEQNDGENKTETFIQSDSYLKDSIVGGIIGYVQNVKNIAISNCNVYFDKIISTASDGNVVCYAGGLFGYIQTVGNQISLEQNINIGHPEYTVVYGEKLQITNKLFIKAGVESSVLPFKAYSGFICANKTLEYSKDNLKNNSSVLSTASYNYNQMVDVSNEDYNISNSITSIDNIKISSFDNFSKIIVHTGETQENIGVIPEFKQIENGYFDAAIYSMDVQYSTQSNSYVNGEQKVMYNYYNQYVVILTKCEYLENEKIGENEFGDYFKFDETIILVEQASDYLSGGDFAITNDIKLHYLRSISYITNSKTFDKSISNRDKKTYFPNVKLFNQTIKEVKVDGNKTEGVCEYTETTLTDWIKNINNYCVSDGLSTDNVDIMYSITDMLSASSMIVYTINNLSFDESHKYLLLNTTTQWMNINSSNNNTTVSETNNKEVMYKYELPSVVKYSGNSSVSSINLGLLDITNEGYNSLYMSNGNEKVLATGTDGSNLVNQNKTEEKPLDLAVNLVQLPYRQINQYSITPLIISIYHLDGDRAIYNDYIFNRLDISNKLYYLGNVTYSFEYNDKTQTNVAPENITSKPRTSLYFPITDQVIVSYENNLLGLNQIKLISDVSSVINTIDIISTKTSTEYYLDYNKGIQYISYVTSTNNTLQFSGTLKGDNASSRNIKVSITAGEEKRTNTNLISYNFESIMTSTNTDDRLYIDSYSTGEKDDKTYTFRTYNKEKQDNQNKEINIVYHKFTQNDEGNYLYTTSIDNTFAPTSIIKSILIDSSGKVLLEYNHNKVIGDSTIYWTDNTNKILGIKFEMNGESNSFEFNGNWSFNPDNLTITNNDYSENKNNIKYYRLGYTATNLYVSEIAYSYLVGETKFEIVESYDNYAKLATLKLKNILLNAEQSYDLSSRDYEVVSDLSVLNKLPGQYFVKSIEEVSEYVCVNDTKIFRLNSDENLSFTKDCLKVVKYYSTNTISASYSATAIQYVNANNDIVKTKLYGILDGKVKYIGEITKDDENKFGPIALLKVQNYNTNVELPVIQINDSNDTNTAILFNYEGKKYFEQKEAELINSSYKEMNTSIAQISLSGGALFKGNVEFSQYYFVASTNAVIEIPYKENYNIAIDVLPVKGKNILIFTVSNENSGDSKVYYFNEDGTSLNDMTITKTKEEGTIFNVSIKGTNIGSTKISYDVISVKIGTTKTNIIVHSGISLDSGDEWEIDDISITSISKDMNGDIISSSVKSGLSFKSSTSLSGNVLKLIIDCSDEDIDITKTYTLKSFEYDASNIENSTVKFDDFEKVLDYEDPKNPKEAIASISQGKVYATKTIINVGTYSYYCDIVNGEYGVQKINT